MVDQRVLNDDHDAPNEVQLVPFDLSRRGDR
jgi:hypothetical protein